MFSYDPEVGVIVGHLPLRFLNSSEPLCNDSLCDTLRIDTRAFNSGVLFEKTSVASKAAFLLAEGANLVMSAPLQFADGVPQCALWDAMLNPCIVL